MLNFTFMIAIFLHVFVLIHFPRLEMLSESDFRMDLQPVLREQENCQKLIIARLNQTLVERISIYIQYQFGYLEPEIPSHCFDMRTFILHEENKQQQKFRLQVQAVYARNHHHLLEYSKLFLNISVISCIIGFSELSLYISYIILTRVLGVSCTCLCYFYFLPCFLKATFQGSLCLLTNSLSSLLHLFLTLVQNFSSLVLSFIVDTLSPIACVLFKYFSLSIKVMVGVGCFTAVCVNSWISFLYSKFELSLNIPYTILTRVLPVTCVCLSYFYFLSCFLLKYFVRSLGLLEYALNPIQKISRFVLSLIFTTLCQTAWLLFTLVSLPIKMMVCVGRFSVISVYSLISFLYKHVNNFFAYMHSISPVCFLSSLDYFLVKPFKFLSMLLISADTFISPCLSLLYKKISKFFACIYCISLGFFLFWTASFQIVFFLVLTILKLILVLFKPSTSPTATPIVPKDSKDPPLPAPLVVATFGGEDLHFIRNLGEGSFGKVVLARSSLSNQYCALKTQPISKQVRMEIDILQKLWDCPFINRLFGAFQEEHTVYMLLQACPKGDLESKLQRVGVLSEYSVKFIIASLILALEDIHSRGIVHRDIKPANILIDNDGYALLADFGLSAKTNTLAPAAGTPMYLAPEVFDSSQVIRRESDYWALGLLTYQLLVGSLPIPELDNEDELITYLKAGDVNLDFPDSVSQLSRNFISSLLVKDPSLRLGTWLNPCRMHPWFEGVDWYLFRCKGYPSLLL